MRISDWSSDVCSSDLQDPDRVAAFLMRLLFTMFAEDTVLIPKASFSALLKKVRDRPELLAPQLSQLWEAMDTGGLAFGLGEAGEVVRQFNGYLFKDASALALDQREINVLIDAAASDWRQVEPAIFGTLLERALNAKERATLGAHFTPRAYVERSEEHTSELQSLMRISYAVFCLKKQKPIATHTITHPHTN